MVGRKFLVRAFMTELEPVLLSLWKRLRAGLVACRARAEQGQPDRLDARLLSASASARRQPMVGSRRLGTAWEAAAAGGQVGGQVFVGDGQFGQALPGLAEGVVGGAGEGGVGGGGVGG